MSKRTIFGLNFRSIQLTRLTGKLLHDYYLTVEETVSKYRLLQMHKWSISNWKIDKNGIQTDNGGIKEKINGTDGTKKDDFICQPNCAAA